MHISDAMYKINISRYVGNIINNLKHGYGEEYFAEGDYYKG